MDNNAENNEKVSFKAKLSAKADKIKKTTIRVKIMSAALVLVVIIVFVSIFFPLKQDPDTFIDPVKRSQWISNTVIASTLSIVGLILCENILTDTLKNRKGGRYQESLRGYDTFTREGNPKHVEGYLDRREKVRPYERDFSDWLSWYSKNELRKKKLQAIGSKDAEKVLAHLDEITNPILLCDHIEVTKKHWWSRKVKEEVKGVSLTMADGTVIDRKTEGEVRGIMLVKDGEIKVYPYEAPYYMNLDATAINVSQVDKADMLNKGKFENQLFSRTFKIIIGILMSVYWALVTVDDFSNLVSAQAWLLLIIRLGTLVGGMVSGWTGADMGVKFDTDMVNDRSDMLETFYYDMSTGRFDKVRYEEELRKEAEAKHGTDDTEKAGNADKQTSPIYVIEESSGDSRQSDSEGLVS